MGENAGTGRLWRRRQAAGLILGAAGLMLGPARAQDAGDGSAAFESPDLTETPSPAEDSAQPRDPHVGPVTHLPLPRYVSLKTNEGNARRGPGLSHRIDWVFTRAGMPLQITAEFEHWRRVQDQDGAGGWMNYALLSGVRTVIVTTDMTEFREAPDPTSAVAFQAERDVIGRLLAAQGDWARVVVQGDRGWARKSDLWGVDPGESFG
jgi:SH3-like domain-containing protein